MIDRLLGLSPKVYIIGALVAGIALWVVILNIRLNVLRSELKDCQATVAVGEAKLTQCEANGRVWQGKVGEQNEAIQKWRKEAAARAQESARMLARAREAARKAEERAKDLEARLAAPTPPEADARQAVLEIRAQLNPEKPK